MNPSSRETSGISLPPPVAEQAPGQSDGVPAASAPENLASAPETAPSAGTSQPVFSQPAAQQPPIPAPAQSNAQAGGASAPPLAGQPMADDNDKVEREWVDKARRIVEQTRYDPHRQSEELTVVKADYMKQRYNKIIKVEK